MTTIHEFLMRFPDEEACIQELIKQRKDKCCGRLYRVKGKYALVCACGKQIAMKAGTIFEKSSTKLWDWYYAIFRLSGKPGVSAKQLQREIGVTYKCAFRMLHRIRELMREDLVLEGTVEVDEAYVGGNMRPWASEKYEMALNKDVVLGMVERKGRIKTHHLPAINSGLVLRKIGRGVKIGSEIFTDGYGSYKALPGIGYKHDFVEHIRQYARGKVNTNTIEGYWNQLKTGLKGTYFGVSSANLQCYLNEFSYRYNHPDSFSCLMERLLV